MILAAGYGKRLAPLTDNIPKPLLEVGTQSLIKRNINYLVDNGFSEIIINVSYLGEKITNHVKAEFPNLDILFSTEDEPLGTGGGILHALPIIGDEPFLLMNSDIVSIHLVLGDKYKNLISKKELEMMKKTSFLINTSRGPIINENDLVQALKDEKIAGAGLDVYNIEPLPQDHKLRFLSNALLLPHIGYVTAENYSKFYSQMIENLISCLKNKPIRTL